MPRSSHLNQIKKTFRPHPKILNLLDVNSIRFDGDDKVESHRTAVKFVSDNNLRLADEIHFVLQLCISHTHTDKIRTPPTTSGCMIVRRPSFGIRFLFRM